MAPLSPFLPEFGSPLGIALIAFAAIAVLHVVNAAFLADPFPKDVQLIREPPGKRSFSLRTRWAYMTDCENLFREAYEDVRMTSFQELPTVWVVSLTVGMQYIKKGKPVILPGFGVRKELILPTSSMRWVQAQSDSVLSVFEALAAVDQAYYSFGHDKYVVDPWQGSLVKNKMNAVLENIARAMNDELQAAFDDEFGTDEHNWKELDVMESSRVVVARAASQFTTGLPLGLLPGGRGCHDRPRLSCSQLAITST